MTAHITQSELYDTVQLLADNIKKIVSAVTEWARQLPER